MSHYQQSDEIDLFDLIARLWRQKWIIIFFMVFFIFVGMLYQKIVKPTFEVTASYQINPYLLFNQAFNRVDKQEKLIDIESQLMNAAFNVNNTDWRLNERKKQLEIATKNKLSLAEYQQVLAALSEKIQQSMKKQAEYELSLFGDDIDLLQSSNDYAAMHFLHAKRILTLVDKGDKIVSFSTPVLKEKLNMVLFFALLSFLGAFLGSALVLIREAVSSYKARESLPS